MIMILVVYKKYSPEKAKKRKLRVFKALGQLNSENVMYFDYTIKIGTKCLTL